MTDEQLLEDYGKASGEREGVLEKELERRGIF